MTGIGTVQEIALKTAVKFIKLKTKLKKGEHSGLAGADSTENRTLICRKIQCIPLHSFKRQ